MRRLEQEIQRTRPFEVPEEEAMLSVMRTAEVLGQAAAVVIKPFQLTPGQFNVLRILRGAGEHGLPANEIASRMLSHDPDVTRLLQRLEARGLISRKRSCSDGRVVLACVTAEGLALLHAIDAPMIDHHRRFFQHMPPEHVRQLIALLAECRESPESRPYPASSPKLKISRHND